MPSKLSTIEAASALEIPLSTLRSWSEKLGIGAVSPSGKRTYADDDLALLATVRTLRNEDCLGLTTISKRLNIGTVGNVPPHTDDEPQLSAPTEQEPLVPAIDADELAQMVSHAVTTAIRADNELAEKYAHAAHRIGELEAENRSLRSEVAHLRQVLSLPLWRYVMQGRRMLSEAIGGNALPPGGS